MSLRRGVGSLIGIGFLMMILTLGFSYYNVINRIEDTSNDRIQLMVELDRDAADEELEITRVKLTVGNSLNLTIKNAGNIFSELEWVGVFDGTLGTQDYFRLDESLNPVETQKNIGNASIVMNPLNDYTIQVLTKLGNMYFGEYPEPVTWGTGGGIAYPYYSEYEIVDLQPDTTVGIHSLFGAMKAGPDEILNTLSEVNAINQSLISDESFEGGWRPTGWAENPGNSRWNREDEVIYDGGWSADFDGGGAGVTGSLETPTLDCTNMHIIYLDFWYYEDDLEPGEFSLEYYDGTTWDLIADLGSNTEDVWHNYQEKISDPQYLISDFQVRWVVSGARNGEKAYVDLVNIIKRSAPIDYELDLEVLWSDLPSLSNEYLMFFGGAQGSEDLQVDVWNGVAWVTVITDVQEGWNNIDVSTYLTGSTLNIRFKDTNLVSDLIEDSWEIDTLVLNLFD